MLLLFSIVVSLSIGSASMSLVEVWRILLYKLPGFQVWIEPTWSEAAEQIVLEVRMSRVILAALVGAAFGVAGTAFQGVLRNPLADPYTLGVASGSSVGAAAVILFGLQTAIGIWTVPMVAFFTGVGTLAIVLMLARTEGKIHNHTLLLSGVVMQAFFGALVSFMVASSNKLANELIFWLMGSLSMRGWEYSWVLIPYLAVGTIVLLGYGHTLNLLALGERQASYLGVHVQRSKLIVLLVSTLLTAAAVSVAGVVGFVGLVVPHLIRLALGPDYRLMMPLSALMGAIYVLWADTIARMLLSPQEIPLGVVTAIIGAPFFAYLLKRQKVRARGMLD